MVDKTYGKKRRRFVFLLVGAALVAGSCLFYNLVMTAGKTTSPSKEYQASYHQISKIITVQALNSGVKWHVGYHKNPVLLWSPNSRFLAMTTTGIDGSRKSEIMDIEHSSGIALPIQSDIQELLHMSDGTQTTEGNTRVEIIKWLDNRNVLVEFSWPSDALGQTMTGWFIFECSSRSIKELTLLE